MRGEGEVWQKRTPADVGEEGVKAKCGQGRGQKLAQFCGRPLWMTPYIHNTYKNSLSMSKRQLTTNLGFFKKYCSLLPLI